MNIKKYLVAISLGMIASLFNFGESLALDEWNNKVKMETSVNLPKSKRKIEIAISHEEIYDFKIDKWSTYKYALELGTKLTEHIGFAVEYKYVDKKNKKDYEEIEGDLFFEYKFPLKIELKDENKLVTNIRKGNQVYENEIELCREIAKFSKDRRISLLVGDIIAYDFHPGK